MTSALEGRDGGDVVEGPAPPVHPAVHVEVGDAEHGRPPTIGAAGAHRYDRRGGNGGRVSGPPPAPVHHDDLRHHVRAGDRDGCGQPGAGFPRHRRSRGAARSRRRRHPGGPQPVPAERRHPRAAPGGGRPPACVVRPRVRRRHRGPRDRRRHRGHRGHAARPVRARRRGRHVRADLRLLRGLRGHGRRGAAAGAAAPARLDLRTPRSWRPRSGRAPSWCSSTHRTTRPARCSAPTSWTRSPRCAGPTTSWRSPTRSTSTSSSRVPTSPWPRCPAWRSAR